MDIMLLSYTKLLLVLCHCVYLPFPPQSRYFHCNFGFNTTLFDRLHDTLRRNDREYGEHIFYGKGKPKENTE